MKNNGGRSQLIKKSFIYSDCNLTHPTYKFSEQAAYLNEPSIVTSNGSFKEKNMKFQLNILKQNDLIIQLD